MDVIVLASWRIWTFVEESGATALRSWLSRIEASEAEVGRVKALFDLYIASGDRAVAQCSWELQDGIAAWKSIQKGGRDLVLIFQHIPRQREITFLQGAFWMGKEIRPYTAVGQALENLKTLMQDPSRRRYERPG